VITCFWPRFIHKTDLVQLCIDRVIDLLLFEGLGLVCCFGLAISFGDGLGHVVLSIALVEAVEALQFGSLADLRVLAHLLGFIQGQGRHSRCLVSRFVRKWRRCNLDAETRVISVVFLLGRMLCRGMVISGWK